VYAIKAYVNSILYNLISNAIKYKNPDRKLVVTIRSYQDDDLLYLEVEDNGIGIDLENHQHKIFGIYKRFHATIEGKGLGLHIVKLQVEAMGGKIEVSSRPLKSHFDFFCKEKVSCQAIKSVKNSLKKEPKKYLVSVHHSFEVKSRCCQHNIDLITKHSLIEIPL